MKKIFNAYLGFPLIGRIAIGLVIGICLGLWVPQAGFVTIFGDIFVGALKAIAPILVFVLVIACISVSIAVAVISNFLLVKNSHNVGFFNILFQFHLPY